MFSKRQGAPEPSTSATRKGSPQGSAPKSTTPTSNSDALAQLSAPSTSESGLLSEVTPKRRTGLLAGLHGLFSKKSAQTTTPSGPAPDSPEVQNALKALKESDLTGAWRSEFTAAMTGASQDAELAFFEAYRSGAAPADLFEAFIRQGAPQRVNVAGSKASDLKAALEKQDSAAIQAGLKACYNEVWKDCRESMLDIIAADPKARERMAAQLALGTVSTEKPGETPSETPPPTQTAPTTQGESGGAPKSFPVRLSGISRLFHKTLNTDRWKTEQAEVAKAQEAERLRAEERKLMLEKRVIGMTPEMALGPFRDLTLAQMRKEGSVELVAFIEGLDSGMSKQEVYETFLAPKAPMLVNASSASRTPLHELAAQGNYDAMNFDDAKATSLSEGLVDVQTRLGDVPEAIERMAKILGV